LLPPIIKLLKENHYRDIIRLLIAYEIRGRGLKQTHIRYALDIKPELHPETIKHMERFFIGTLEKFFETGISFPRYLPNPMIFQFFDAVMTNDRLYTNLVFSERPKNISLDIWIKVIKTNQPPLFPMKKGCISSKNNLTNFLLKLEKYNYIKRKKHKRWSISPFFWEKYFREKNMASVNRMSASELSQIAKKYHNLDLGDFSIFQDP
jgi:hypothetical protein